MEDRSQLRLHVLLAVAVVVLDRVYGVAACRGAQGARHHGLMLTLGTQHLLEPQAMRRTHAGLGHNAGVPLFPALPVGFGRIVASEIAAPVTLGHLVWSGCALVQS